MISDVKISKTHELFPNFPELFRPIPEKQEIGARIGGILEVL